MALASIKQNIFENPLYFAVFSHHLPSLFDIEQIGISLPIKIEAIIGGLKSTKLYENQPKSKICIEIISKDTITTAKYAVALKAKYSLRIKEKHC